MRITKQRGKSKENDKGEGEGDGTKLLDEREILSPRLPKSLQCINRIAGRQSLAWLGSLTLTAQNAEE